LVLKLCDSVEVFVEQVLADEGRAKAIAFDEIDKAPEEKKRGITIATVKKNTVHFIFFFKSILKSSIL
jgi:translation elongation factor EF-Tu-like GTPase